MFLNASIIYEELSKTLNVSMSGYSGKNEHLRFPLYFTPGTMLREDRVYVCDSAELSADTRFPSRCCIVSSDPITAGSHTDNCTFITVNEPMDKAALFNHVQQVFEKYSQWEQELNALVHNNSGIHDILKHSQTLYEGIFFLIVDVNYRVLATTSPPDYFAFISDETGSTPQSVLARFKKDPEYIRKRFDRKTYLYNGIYFDHGILTHHIFINDELSGTFTMTEHGTPITDGKWAIFEHLCAIVDKFYQSRFNLMYRDATRPSAIFQHILSGHTVNAPSKMLAGTLTTVTFPASLK